MRGSSFLCRLLAAALVAVSLQLASFAAAAEPTLANAVRPLLESHPGKTGAFVIEKGEEALLARAWLADHAAESIDVQYFIWSKDNVGILAAEGLLRAAERGVRVRVLVDDLLIDAPPESMLALAAHPGVEIRIYNPKHSVGTSKLKQVKNVVTSFRSANQRMHDKTAIFDRLVGITGGRNMADEYFDFDHRYNFRDRDILVAGPEVQQMAASFERFWSSRLAVPVEKLLPSAMKRMTPERAAAVYRALHEYAADPGNFAPEVRGALARIPEKFPGLVAGMAWEEPRFLCDIPGKNDGRSGLGGGGKTTAELVQALQSAQRRVTIQSPYLLLTDEALELFRGLVRRGVQVRICTNSLASTDNLQAFSGYRKQRKKLLEAGIRIREFRPDPAVRRELIERYRLLEKEAPVFAIHAKTMVIDGETLFVGTFNLDPRSVNLNTEVGILLKSPTLAAEVERQIERDMLPENSWDPAEGNPDKAAPAAKRSKLKGWMALPLDPIL